MIFAELIVLACEIYLVIGVLFAVWFVIFGIAEMDEAARGTGVGFRLMIFAGAAALWWFLAVRLLKGERRPIERTAHRAEAEK
jgi:hypothetical protein